MSTKTSVVWKYAKDGICQVENPETQEICGRTVHKTNTGHVWLHFKRFHIELHDELKRNEEPEKQNQPTMDEFFVSKSGPLKDLALFIATSTAPLSILENERFQVRF